VPEILGASIPGGLTLPLDRLAGLLLALLQMSATEIPDASLVALLGTSMWQEGSVGCTVDGG